MNRSGVMLAAAAAMVFIMAFGVFAQTPAFHDIRPGYGVTGIGWLSDYFPPLKGTPGELACTSLTPADPGAPHTSKAAPTATKSQASWPRRFWWSAPCRRQADSSSCLTATTPTSTTTTATEPTCRRRLQLKSKAASSASSATAHAARTRRMKRSLTRPSTSAPTEASSRGEEIRNLNRVHPGKADGTLTEQIAYAIRMLLIEENVDIAIDLHEAGVTSRLANTLVAHDRAMEPAVLAVLDLSMQGIHINLEPSRDEFRGLSHREWGDHTPARVLDRDGQPGPDAHHGQPGRH